MVIEFELANVKIRVEVLIYLLIQFDFLKVFRLFNPFQSRDLKAKFGFILALDKVGC